MKKVMVVMTIDGLNAEYILEENIVKAPVGNPSGNDQLFRIKLISKQLKRIKVYATHIFYDLSDNFLVDVAPTSKDGNGAINWITSRTMYQNDFTCSSDITKIASARYVRRNYVDALIGSDNSFAYLDTNSSVVSVTGSNQYIVKDKSQLRVCISSANKMVAQATYLRWENHHKRCSVSTPSRHHLK